jgi:hypothetical protein
LSAAIIERAYPDDRRPAIESGRHLEVVTGIATFSSESAHPSIAPKPIARLPCRKDHDGDPMTSRRVKTIGAGALLGLATLAVDLPAAQARPSLPASACPTPATVGDADIVYLGQYGGAGPGMPYALGNAGHTTRYTKVIGSPKRPTYFVVSAYEPTVWDFSGVSGALVRGVHGSGFYEQGVTGVPSSAPVTLRHTSANNAADPTALRDRCLDILHKYEANAIPEIAGRISSQFGRNPSYALMTYQTQIFDLGFDANKPTMVLSVTPPDPDSIRTENDVNSTGLQPAEAGLVQLVASGHLMPVHPSVVSEWSARGMLLPEGRIASNMMQGGIRVAGANAFVVLKSVDKLPDGLFGAHQATFVLPKGIKAPTDMDTHSMFYRYSGPEQAWEAFRSTPQGPFFQSGFSGPMILRVSPSYGMTRVDWDPSGQVRLSTSQPRYEQGPAFGGSQYVPPAQQTMPSTPNPFPSNRRDEDVPFWPLAVIGLGGLAFWQRKRIAEAWRSDASVASSSPTDTTPPTTGTPAPVSSGSPGERVIDLTSRVIDATENDATIAEMFRLRRDLFTAVSREWDDDIANELEATVRHCSAASTEYLALRGKTMGDAAVSMETSLLETARTVRGKLRDLTEQQGRRDAGSVATHETFIRRRHGPDDLHKGDQA